MVQDYIQTKGWQTEARLSATGPVAPLLYREKLHDSVAVVPTTTPAVITTTMPKIPGFFVQRAHSRQTARGSGYRHMVRNAQTRNYRQWLYPVVAHLIQ